MLPKILDLFESIPSYLPSSFFKNFNKHLSKCIWNNKMPRINFSKLMKPRDEGGIALPNLQLYYRATHMISWCSERTNSIWYNMEAAICSRLPIRFLPYVKFFTKLKGISEHYVIFNTLWAWRDINTYLKIPPLSSSSSLSFNPDFPSTFQNIGLSAWMKLGISQISFLPSEGILQSF